MPVDAHPAHHLVIGGGEQRILDPVRVSVEAALLSERFDLGVRGSGLGHGGFWGTTPNL